MWFVGSNLKRALHLVTSAALPVSQPLSFSRNLGMILVYPEPSAYICKSAVLAEDLKRYALLQAILSAPRTFCNTNEVAPQQAYHTPSPPPNAATVWCVLDPGPRRSHVSNGLRPSYCSLQLRRCYWKTPLATGFVG